MEIFIHDWATVEPDGSPQLLLVGKLLLFKAAFGCKFAAPTQGVVPIAEQP